MLLGINVGSMMVVIGDCVACVLVRTIWLPVAVIMCAGRRSSTAVAMC